MRIQGGRDRLLGGTAFACLPSEGSGSPATFTVPAAQFIPPTPSCSGAQVLPIPGFPVPKAKTWLGAGFHRLVLDES